MQKKKIRINILDFLIIAIVLLCICGAIFRGYMKDRDDKLNTKEVVIEFKISDIQGESAQFFETNAPVYNEDFDCPMGKIYSLDSPRIAKGYEHTGKGTVQTVYSDIGRIDLTGTIVCSGTMTKEGGFKLDGAQYLAPGKMVKISVPKLSGSILITDITLKSEYDAGR